MKIHSQKQHNTSIILNMKVYVCDHFYLHYQYTDWTVLKTPFNHNLLTPEWRDWPVVWWWAKQPRFELLSCNKHIIYICHSENHPGATLWNFFFPHWNKYCVLLRSVLFGTTPKFIKCYFFPVACMVNSHKYYLLINLKQACSHVWMKFNNNLFHLNATLHLKALPKPIAPNFCKLWLHWCWNQPFNTAAGVKEEWESRLLRLLYMSWNWISVCDPTFIQEWLSFI